MILNYYNDLLYQPSELFLSKDFGQVATVLGRLHGSSVQHLICCNTVNESLSTFAGNNVFQAKKSLRFLPSKVDFLKNIRGYLFLWRHRKKFSILVMLPFTPLSDLLMVRTFLALNPNAKIIIKLDANVDHLERLQQAYKSTRIGFWRQHVSYRELLVRATTVIYETRNVGRLLKEKNFLELNSPQKFVNVYNGVSEQQMSDTAPPRKHSSERNNVIIFSGRLSAPQKNVELIFKSDPVPPGWKIRFLGKVDETFRRVIEEYKQNDSRFDEKYEFLGELADKGEYYKAFSAGKILLLCSNWEGFPMVYSEAHYFGLYIVTTSVSGADEATDGGRLGTVVPPNDPGALKAALLSVCTHTDIDAAIALARGYGQQHFVWERSLRTPRVDSVFEKS